MFRRFIAERVSRVRTEVLAEDENDDVKKTLEVVSALRLNPELVHAEESVSPSEGGFGVVRRGLLLECGAIHPDEQVEVRRTRQAVEIEVIRKTRWKTKKTRYPLQKTTDVAIKYLKLAGAGDFSRTERRFAREVLVWAKLDHPNVSPLLGFYIDATLQEAWFVSPWENNGNVREYVVSQHVSGGLRLQFLKDIVTGLVYLHGLKPPVIHGDVKAANVLVTQDLRARLCDFGMALGLGSAEQEVLATTTGDGVKGSLRWCAPELFANEKRSSASDAWMWGMTAYEIATGKIPHHDVGDGGVIIGRILRDLHPTLNGVEGIPDKLFPLLGRCWSKTPEMRPTMVEISETLLIMIAADWQIPNSTYSKPASSETAAPVGPAMARHLENIAKAAELKTLVSAGGMGGIAWSDLSFLQDLDSADISAIHVYYEMKIHELRVKYQTSQGPIWATAHGSSAGNWEMKKYLFELEEGERIVEVSGRAGHLVGALQFTTNTGRQSKWLGSRRNGEPFKFTGSKLVYFSGRAGNQLDAIRPHWEDGPSEQVV